jgi:metabolite-proton symporter
MAAPRLDGDGVPAPRASGMRKVIVASLIGTTLEWYDFFIYGSAAALVFNELFFPQFDPLVGTLLAFTTYAVGFVARPLGGVVFGHYGDRVGRKTVLVVTLLVMGVSTFLIGLLPTYESIGVVAPLLLVALRFVQGLGLGGEWGGAVLMVTEHGAHGRRGFYASWVQVGVPAGLLLSNGVLAILSGALSEAQFESWGWRVPFLLSAVLIVVGIFIRLAIAESPLFQEVERTGTKARAPIVDVFRLYPRSIVIALGARVGVDIAFYIFVLFILTYVTEQLDLPRGTALGAVLAGSALQLFLVPFFGALSDRLGRRPVYLAGAVGALVWAFAFFALLDTRSTAFIVLAAVGGLFWHAMMYGPQAAFLSELFGTRVRYSGASVGYQLAGIFGGALAPIIAVALLARFGSTLPISIYLVVALAITIAAVLVATETSKVELEAAKPEEREIVEHPEAFGTRPG